MALGQNRRFGREINCDFFRVRVGKQGNGDFIRTVQDWQQGCQSVTERNLPTEDGFVRLHDWQVTENNASGALLRLRTDGSARIARVETDEVRDLELQDNEALAEYSCFRYFGEFQTLVIHHNRDAGSYSRLAVYLSQQTKVYPIDFQTLVAADALNLFERLQEITVAEISIAMPTNLGPETQGRDLSVGEEIALAQRSNAAIVTTKLSMGHTRRSLSIDVIKDLFRRQLAQHGEDVRSAEVRGRVERGEEIRTVDLIQDRIREKVRLEMDGKRPSFENFYSALGKAYNARREEIEQMFRPGVS